MIQQLDRESSNIYGDEFGVFYGTFEAGRKSGYGIEIDDVGVFAGTCWTLLCAVLQCHFGSKYATMLVCY
jgi:hypothetical protein